MSRQVPFCPPHPGLCRGAGWVGGLLAVDSTYSRLSYEQSTVCPCHWPAPRAEAGSQPALPGKSQPLRNTTSDRRLLLPASGVLARARLVLGRPVPPPQGHKDRRSREILLRKPWTGHLLFSDVSHRDAKPWVRLQGKLESVGTTWEA